MKLYRCESRPFNLHFLSRLEQNCLAATKSCKMFFKSMKENSYFYLSISCMFYHFIYEIPKNVSAVVTKSDACQKVAAMLILF